eukprot:2467394-Pleurochrysis_carterae.AAC.1
MGHACLDGLISPSPPCSIATAWRMAACRACVRSRVARGLGAHGLVRTSMPKQTRLKMCAGTLVGRGRRLLPRTYAPK